MGAGSNYINGNAGNDAITVGVDVAGPVAASTGANRVLGGQGVDTITVHGAGGNSVNGNLGNDVIDATTATGNNSLRGGQGDDKITSGHGHDALLGDLGNDTLVVSGTASDGHLTVLTGGAGSDTFDFHTVGAGTAIDLSSAGVASAATFGSKTYYQEVTDFTVGTDSIDLANAGSSTNFAVLKSSFANVLEAYNAATNDFNAAGGTHTIDAAQVGGDTYLFFRDAVGGPTEVVKLDGVTAANLDYHSIV